MSLDCDQLVNLSVYALTNDWENYVDIDFLFGARGETFNWWNEKRFNAQLYKLPKGVNIKTEKTQKAHDKWKNKIIPIKNNIYQRKTSKRLG